MKPNSNYNLSQSLMDAVSKIMKNKADNDNNKEADNDAANDNKKAANDNKKAANDNNKAKIGKGPREPVNLKPTIID